ncbi:MAG: ankyrin repeat domain-containing protein [Planctomycetia bacterium]|nr:MAG: ankyrin repeat domain-containing protein [Planctomycetia bacterium]
MTGHTPDADSLRRAAARGDTVQVGELLKRGVNPGAVGRDGKTALHHAARTGRVKVVRQLLTGGAEVDVDSQIFAHENSDRRILKLLHDHGMNQAIRRGSREWLERLLADGASVSARNSDLRTPLHTAAACGNAEAGAILIDHGADVNARDSGAETPLHGAAACGSREMVELLVRHGADASAEDSAGMTPENFARTMGQHAVAEILHRAKHDPKEAVRPTGHGR